MQTEVVRIIEGGLSGDKSKVYNYARTLADNLEADGEGRFAKRVRSALAGKSPGAAVLDGMALKPVDQESRMDMVDVEYVQPGDVDLVLSPYLESETRKFVSLHANRFILEKRGVDAGSSLLLYGPPGCGKTSIARLIAAETGLPLVTTRLDGLVSSLLGSTAKNIRKVFDFASQRECVLFLDEFDVVAKRRDDENELGELKRVVNSLIQNIDGFPRESILIAATNHQDLLDPAIWRRFGRVVEIPRPGRAEIERYVEAFFLPLMDERPKPRHIAALCGLSYSDLDTAAKNAFCDAAMRGHDKFTVFDLLRQTYLARRHGISDEEDFIEYMLSNGCSQADLHEGGQIPLRTIKAVSKTIREKADNA